MSEDPGVSDWHIVQHNVAKSRFNLMNLLFPPDEHNIPDILLIQEPPWYKIGIDRERQTIRYGQDLYGLPTLNMFHVYLPPGTDSYSNNAPRACILFRRAVFPQTHLTLISSHSMFPTLVTVRVTGHDSFENIHISSLYIPPYQNDLPAIYRAPLPSDAVVSRLELNQHHAIRLLLDRNLQPLPYWFMGGDFNRHSQRWSHTPTYGQNDFYRSSPHLAQELDDLHLILRTEPGTITRKPYRGRNEDQRHSTIDLSFFTLDWEDVWINIPLKTSFDSASNSDHAVISMRLPSNTLTTPPMAPIHVHNDQLDAWMKTISPPLRDAFALPLDTTDDLDACAQALLDALALGTEPRNTTRKHHPWWWNRECKQHLINIRDAPDHIERARLRTETKKIHRKAKRENAETFLEHCDPGNIWATAKWCNGRRAVPIPGLKTGNTFATTNEEKTAVFMNKYYGVDAPLTAPLPLPSRAHYKTPLPDNPITQDELQNALKTQKNRSAPGPSGLMYGPLKRILAAFPDELLLLYNRCLALGHHPKPWRNAKVVMLRKFNKPDPTAPNAYRPITLEETFGKILEKIIATRLQWYGTDAKMLDSRQYGGRKSASVHDAASNLVAQIENGFSLGHTTIAVFVDVSGFFPSVQHHILQHELKKLRLPDNIIRWCMSFLSNRTVTLSFDGFTAQPVAVPNLGVPQGSPISPILANLYAAPCLQSIPDNLSTRAFVDDHSFAGTVSPPQIPQLITRLQRAYLLMDTSFRARGCVLDGPKTELGVFYKNKTSPMPNPYIDLTDSTNAVARIPVTPVVKWLGIWFDTKLTFLPHLYKYAAKSSSALNAISLVGKTLEGMHPKLLRQLYIGCVVPLLTWGSTIWYRPNGKNTAIKNHLSKIQYRAIKLVMGTLGTSPQQASEAFAGIMPIDIRIANLQANAALRPLHTQHAHLGEIYTCSRPSHSTPHLMSLCPDPRFAETIPVRGPMPWRKQITPPNLLILSCSRFSEEERTQVQKELRTRLQNAPNDHLNIFTDGSRLGPAQGPHRCGYAQVWIKTPTTDPPLFEEGTYDGNNKHATDCELHAIEAAARRLASKEFDPSPYSEITIYSDCDVAIQQVDSQSRTPGYDSAKAIRKYLTRLTLAHPLIRVALEWCPAHVGIDGNERADTLAKQAAELPTDTPGELRAQLPSIRWLREQNTNRYSLQWETRMSKSRESKPSSQALRLAPHPPTPHPPTWWYPGVSRKPVAQAQQLLLAHSPVGEYLKRFSPAHIRRKRGSHPCHCGKPYQTIKHLVADCPATEEARNLLWPYPRFPPYSIDDLLPKTSKPPTHTPLVIRYLSVVYSAQFRPDPPLPMQEPANARPP